MRARVLTRTRRPTNKVRSCERSEPRSEPVVGQARPSSGGARGAQKISLKEAARFELRTGKASAPDEIMRAIDRGRGREAGESVVKAEIRDVQRRLSFRTLMSPRPSSGGRLHDQHVASIGIGMVRRAGPVERIIVRTILISAPQHAHTKGARGFRNGADGTGLNFSSRCSKAIRRLQFGCRKPKLRARRNPLGRTCCSTSQRKSRTGRRCAVPSCRSWRCDSESSPGRCRRRRCPARG